MYVLCYTMSNKTGNSNIVDDGNNNRKIIKFHLDKPVQVTKVFAREDHRLTINDPIFSMVDAHNPGIVK